MNKKNSRAEIHGKISLSLLYGISFFLPVYGRIVPALIALLWLNWVVEGSYIKTFSGIFSEKKRRRTISFSLIYIMYLIGLIWTTDFSYARFDLEVKLSLLILPLIFSTSAGQIISPESFAKLIRIFGLGCLAGSLVLYGHATWNSLVLSMPGAFYYSNLSWYFHPAYLAMYMTFVISNVLYNLLIRQTVVGFRKQAAHIIMLIYLLVFIILLSSKAGLLAVLVMILYYSVLLGWRYRQWGKSALFLSVSLLIFFAGLLVFPYASERVSQAGRDIAESKSSMYTGNSTSDRISIWKAALTIISANPVFGVGTGDVKNELVREYQAQHVLPAYEKMLNAHNQYLQTAVALGFTGFMVLMAILFGPAISSIRRKDYMYGAFLLIIILNITFESMFETQAGVVFYAFFNMIYFCNSESYRPG